jgi:cell division protein FtsZ
MVRPGLVNLDFADVESIMSSMGKAMMGTGEAEGENRAINAAEQAISNPLIDDYSLKGAKGLLINITGGKDLTLFEVDEVVKKITSEVDPEVEFIKGCIIDPSLEGRLRVSIVATSLDGQQPESKSVINMVHRIQNRNPGYSDFSNLRPNYSYELNKGLSTSGANALKIETSDIKVSENDLMSSMVDEKMAVENPITSEAKNEENSLEEKLILSDNDINTSGDESNGLENFNLDAEDPQLFDETQSINSDHETNINEDTDSDEEDELEIPAFLRRQKN